MLQNLEVHVEWAIENAEACNFAGEDIQGGSGMGGRMAPAQQSLLRAQSSDAQRAATRTF